MTLAQFNIYLCGYNEKLVREGEDQIVLAYHTAAFTNAEKPRSLEYYLKKYRGDDGSENNPIDHDAIKRMNQALAKSEQEG